MFIPEVSRYLTAFSHVRDDNSFVHAFHVIFESVNTKKTCEIYRGAENVAPHCYVMSAEEETDGLLTERKLYRDNAPFNLIFFKKKIQ